MKLIKTLVIPVIALGLAFTGCGNKNVSKNLKTELDSVSYALGINIASSIKSGPLNDADPAVIAKGIQDVFNEKEGIMTNEEAIEFLNNYFMKEQSRKAKENLEAGNQFLEKNADREGVITDPEGYQYEIITEGSGASPKETDRVRVHYHGTRIDGTVFDSSVERGEPAEFGLNRVIRGWTLGLQKMKIGAKYKFYFPPHLAYGENPRPGGAIEPNDVLIFEVELLEIVK